MKSFVHKIPFAALALAAAPLAMADVPPVSLGIPSYGGNGCPAGSASATLSPDAQSLSILFDNYQAEAGGVTGQTIDRKSCNIAIPVNVPSGYSVSVFKIDYRGFNALPAGAQSTFNVEYFFAGQNGPRFSQPFYGPLNQDYTLHNDLIATAQVWSNCGESVNLRTNTSIQVQTNQRNEQALATVDSADVQSSVVYYLQWRTCGGQPVPPQPLPPQPLPPQPFPPQPFPPRPIPAPGRNYCSIQQVVLGRVRVYQVQHANGTVIYTTPIYQDAVNHMQAAAAVCSRP